MDDMTNALLARSQPSLQSVPTSPARASAEMPPPSSTNPRKRKATTTLVRPPMTVQSSASPSAASVDGDADDDQDDGEYDPLPGGGAAGAGSRRTGGPTFQSGSKRSRVSSSSGTVNAGAEMAPKVRQLSREQLRKANHSLIEKRRREKINAALQALRDMVPSLGGPDTSGKAGEFKLEVLERTVEHMRELKDHIAELERRMASLPAAGHSHAAHAAADSKETKVSRQPVKVKKRRQPTSTPPTPSTSPDTDSSSEDGVDEYAQEIRAGSRDARPRFGRLRGGRAEDPDETEPEAILPPAGAMAHGRRSRSSQHDSTGDDTTSTASLLPPPSTRAGMPLSFLPGGHAARDSFTSPPRSSEHFAQPSRSGSPHVNYPASLAAHAVPSTRPAAPPQAHNPTLYLPFPTPSPTSPFLTYSTTASSSSGPPEPSPFLAPLQNINMSLFGGAINLDQPAADPSPAVVDHKRSYSQSDRDLDPRDTDADAADQSEWASGADSKRRSKRDMAPEEVANLLLAISSPDTLRPLNGLAGLTPKMIPIGGLEDIAVGGGTGLGISHSAASAALAAGQARLKRRSTLESEDFRLDAHVSSSSAATATVTPSTSMATKQPPIGSDRDAKASAPGSTMSRGPQGKTASDILQL